MRLSDQGIELLDQRLLPERREILVLKSAAEVANAITDMVVRGAPAIGVTAAMGLAVELRQRARAGADNTELRQALKQATERLARARPTAINLRWALDRMNADLAAALENASPLEVAERAQALALQMHDEDVRVCRTIGQVGAAHVDPASTVLTHCNAGGLATAGYGTALGVVRAAAAAGSLQGVIACETRPYLQGARLTAWELSEDEIPVRIITDSMAGSLMASGEVDLVVVGADRIAANGDVANKIGTYSLAVLARAHKIPFYVAAPLSTVDLSTPTGDAIPIEQRDSSEVTELRGIQLAPAGVEALHPAFDITPASLVTAIVTEKGSVSAPFEEGLRGLF